MDDLLVSCDPEVMSAALCFTGTRVPMKNLFDYLEGSSTREDFLEDFPDSPARPQFSYGRQQGNGKLLAPAAADFDAFALALLHEHASLKPKSYTLDKVA